MRKKKHGSERLENCADIIIDSREQLPTLPVSIEIGCGKGGFICELAKREPEKFFIAIERVPDVALLAAERVLAAGIDNVRFIVGDARTLSMFFNKGDVERIYLNFSDPWPKKRHTERRLTHRGFLEKYKKILKKDGWIKMKTDNEGLFEFSLEEFADSGFTLSEVTTDLHASDIENEVMTEYETRFSEQGMNIFHLRAEIKE